MKAIIKRAGEPAEVQDIEDTLKGIQEAVGGFFEVVIRTSGTILLADEDGFAKKLPVNVTLNNVGVIHGTLVVLGSKDADWVGLTDLQVEMWQEFLS